jgi:hypothetical protein
MCSHFMIGRTPQDAIATARERALACASLAETSCVLSPEVGLSVPAVFVYDEEKGVRVLIAPRIESMAGEAAETLVVQPVTGVRLAKRSFHDAITIEALVDGVRRLEQVHLEGEAAYCVQLLWTHFSDECRAILA